MALDIHEGRRFLEVCWPHDLSCAVWRLPWTLHLWPTHWLVDFATVDLCLPYVPRMRQFVAVVFSLTVWLAASQHCNLEETGLLDHQAEAGRACCPGSEHGCNIDGCKVVESSAYRLSESKALVALPALLECCCYLCHVLVAPPTEATLAVKVRIAVEQIKPWVLAWHFERRTVAVPGAPALIFA